MALVCPNVSEVTLLEYLVNKAAPTNPVLRLFHNDVTPSESTIIGGGLPNGLEEANETGYGAITLTGASWTVSTLGGTTTASYAEQTFTFTAGADIYGYYVTSSDVSPKLLYAERFDGAPFQLPSGGGVIAITPRLELA